MQVELGARLEGRPGVLPEMDPRLDLRFIHRGNSCVNSSVKLVGVDLTAQDCFVLSELLPHHSLPLFCRTKVRASDGIEDTVECVSLALDRRLITIGRRNRSRSPVSQITDLFEIVVLNER